MSTKEYALMFIKEFCSCVPKNLFSKIEETQRGIGFILIYLNNAQTEVVAGDLAREMNVSTARIAALLKKMESNHLIVRYDSAQDARKTVVEMTQEGRDYLDKLREDMLRKAELLIEKLGENDLDEFLRISHKIKDVLEASEQ